MKVSHRILFLLLSTLFCSEVSLAKQSCRSSIRNIVAVDLFSSSAMAVGYLREAGFNIVHIHSQPKGLGEPHWEAQHYRSPELLAELEADIHFQGGRRNLRSLVRWLRDTYSPEFVLAGSETGVLLADQLGHGLDRGWIRARGIPHNNFRRSLARIDKYEMHEALKKAGIRHIRQIKSDKLSDILQWSRQLGSWPIVIKPVSSAGTDGVRFAYSEQEIIQAFQAIFQKRNGLGGWNKDVIAQEYIGTKAIDRQTGWMIGEEFSVDTVSWDGVVKVTEFLNYERVVVPGAATLYRSNHLMEPEGEIQDKLFEYAKQVIDALEIRYGPVHMEIKLDQNGEPVLIEMGARFVGAHTTEFVRAATGDCQITQTIRALTSPSDFFDQPERYTKKAHAQDFFVMTQNPGAKYKRDWIENLADLPGVIRVFENFEEGQELPKSVDADSLVLHVQIVHEDEEVMNRTRRTIEAWEAEGRFEQQP